MGEALTVRTVGNAVRTVVAIVVIVGDNEGVVGQAAILKIGGELRERDEVDDFIGAVAHVGKIRKRIVMLGVLTDVAARVADAGQPFGVLFPGFARG